MSKESTMVEFHVKRDGLADTIKTDADKLLKAIDLDALLKDPTMYLTQLGKVFMEVQSTKLDNAFEMGRKYGRDTTP